MSRPEDSGHDRPIEGMEALYVDRTAPADLEDRVVERLHADGWPAAAGRRPRAGLPWLPRLAAAVVVFVAGWGAGRASAGATPAVPVAPTHMLLVWEHGDADPSVPVEAIAAEYGSWMRDVAATGTPIRGQELGEARVLLGPEVPAPAATPVRPSLADRRLGGYFLITATDMPTAAAVAGGHPHLRYGGSIEVAEIVRR